ncbi:NUDIX hydrolase [Arthrobacter psychrolactophilus]|nr:NUDIX hydrolase [Arthrobacter psychrolactophilus]
MTPNPSAPLASLEDACTVVLVRDGQSGLETLLLERPQNSRAFGGAWVFPGGKVDAADRREGNGRSVDDFSAAQRAGLREVAEETGQRLDGDEMVWLSQWTPMQQLPRRFRTWFMLARAVTGSVTLSPEEHSNYAWLSPVDALERHAQGKLTLVPPTWVTLHDLAGKFTVADALADARSNPAPVYNTQLLPPDGLMWLGDAAYPRQNISETVSAPGARHRLTTASLPWIFERRSG